MLHTSLFPKSRSIIEWGLFFSFRIERLKLEKFLNQLYLVGNGNACCGCRHGGVIVFNSIIGQAVYF